VPRVKMHSMTKTKAQVLELRRGRRWAQRRPLPAAGSPGRGRAWINGREVGGGDPRFDHLAVSYD
jgi:hypothetical protein